MPLINLHIQYASTFLQVAMHEHHVQCTVFVKKFGAEVKNSGTFRESTMPNLQFLKGCENNYH